MIDLPIFRAKKIDSDEYVEGIGIEDNTLIEYTFQKSHYSENIAKISEIDLSTISIHFPNMLDRKGNKIFASLQEDGKGGDLVVSKSYPFYGDAPGIGDSSGKCEELNYKGLLFFGFNGCFLDYIKVSERVRGFAVGYLIEEFNEYEYEVVGIQK